MHEKKEALAISFWTSLAGLAVAGLSESVFLVWGRSDFAKLLMLIAAPVFFGLKISSITAGLSEYGSKSGKAALAISIAITITAIVLAIGKPYFRPMLIIWFIAFVLTAWPLTQLMLRNKVQLQKSWLA
jgi:hypothetical protein